MGQWCRGNIKQHVHTKYGPMVRLTVALGTDEEDDEQSFANLAV